MPAQTHKLAVPRNILYVLFCTLSLAFYGFALKNLVTLALNVNEYSHTVLIPFISMVLVILERTKIFAKAGYSPRLGTAVVAAAALIGAVLGASAPAADNDWAFPLRIVSLVLVWIGAFILCYGLLACRAGAFPLALLFLMVPFPEFLLNKIILVVQHGSAEIVSLAFTLSGVPVLRDGFRFLLPDVSIEIARECSGIHSTMALLIVGLLAGHFFLRSNLKRTMLVLSAIPIVCLTNGVRITALTLLGEYVNRSFLSGSLHRDGGFLFFALGMAIMAVVLRLMGFRWPRSSQADAAP